MNDDHRSVLAFDFGEKNIGIAKGQTISRTAEPLCILEVKNGQIDWKGITLLIDEWQPDLLLVGMPTDYDGNEFGIAERVKRFCRQLEGRYHLNVQTINENLSSATARQRLSKKRARNQVRGGKQRLDAHAAQAILETWFEENV